MAKRPCRWQKGHTDGKEAVQMAKRPCRWRIGPADGAEALQMARRPCRWRGGHADGAEAMQMSSLMVASNGDIGIRERESVDEQKQTIVVGYWPLTN